MALELKNIVNSTQDGEFAFYETTGAYNPGNTTGWGAPNEDLSNVLAVKIDAFLSDPSTYLPTSTFVTIDSGEGLTTSIFPTTDNTTVFNITGAMLGYGATSKIPDGIYELIYTVTIDVGGLGNQIDVLTNRVYVIMTSQVECCLAKMAVKGILEMSGCNCPGKLSNFELGMLMIQAAKYAISCNNITAASQALARAKEICGGCSGC